MGASASLRLELAWTPESASAAREAVAALVSGAWPGHRRLLDDALIVTGELVGNAVRHGSAPVVVDVEAAGDGLTITCSDGGPWRPPQPGDGGRGLDLVRAVSTEVVVATTAGTTVTAHLQA